VARAAHTLLPVTGVLPVAVANVLESPAMRRLHKIARNPFAVALAVGFSLLGATATVSANILPPTQ
jgi:hypothetical protein